MTPTFELMRDAVATGYMPFKTTGITPPVAPLDAEEKGTLIRWTTSCAPARSTACIPVDDAGDATDVALDGRPRADK